MKRIMISVAMIGITVASVATATYAYFSDGQVLGNNTFATGNVHLGGFNVQSLTVTGLAPGIPVVVPNIGINYIGDLNADLYVGARGTSAPGSHTYLADKLYLRIYPQGSTSTVVWEGYVNALSTDWRSLATNITAGWQAFDLQFTLDPLTGNDKQGISNTDTEILVYAVQHGGALPAQVPYLSAGSSWF
jgi:predicted ribosomally synthesized peptide with SipW-like signal peptide